MAVHITIGSHRNRNGFCVTLKYFHLLWFDKNITEKSLSFALFLTR